MAAEAVASKNQPRAKVRDLETGQIRLYGLEVHELLWIMNFLNRFNAAVFSFFFHLLFD